MKILIISDIHANLNALNAVLDDAGDIDSAWCLGDIVGYGPDPNECIKRISEIPNLTCIMGNHDAALVDLVDIKTFNDEARQSIDWTRDIISASSLDYLLNLTNKTIIVNTTLVHGSPRHPIWEYVLDTHTALCNFSHFDTPCCFFGHTHVPAIFELSKDNASCNLKIPHEGMDVSLSSKLMINPGSVGQPRDNDPRASFIIYLPDDSRLVFHRVSYAITDVQKRMSTIGLPNKHILRLASGW